MENQGGNYWKNAVILVSVIFLLLTSGYLKSIWRYSDGMKEVHSKFYTIFACQNDAFWKPLSDYYTVEDEDVFVATIGRSGTMYMINLLHQLRTGGDDSFTSVEKLGHLFIPFYGPKVAELPLPQVGAPPRLFYTHGMPQHTPVVNYTIYVQRDHKDIVRSWYWFLVQYLGLHKLPSMEELYFNCVRKHCSFPQDSLPVSNAEWWKVHKERDILWLHFEDLMNKNSTLTMIRRLQRYLGPIRSVQRDPAKILDKLKYKFLEDRPHLMDMHTHNNNLDQVLARCGHTGDLNSTRPFHAIKSTHHLRKTVTLSQQILQHLDKSWRRIIYPATGFASYGDMLSNCKKMFQ